VGTECIEITRAGKSQTHLPPMEDDGDRVSTFEIREEDIFSFWKIITTESDMTIPNLGRKFLIKEHHIISYISLLNDFEIEGKSIIENDSSMIKSCKELILEMCNNNNLITSSQIIKEARNRWPNNKRWNTKDKNGEIKFIHDINNARQILLESGEICNPEISKYRLVNDSDFVDLSYEGDLWPQVSLKLFEAAVNQEVCASRDQKSSFEFILDGKKPKIINYNGSKKTVTEKQFDTIIWKLQLCGGKMQRPFKNEAELAALVHCCDLLQFKNDFVYLKNNNPIEEIDEKNDTTIRDLFNRSKNRASGKSGTHNKRGKKIPFELDEKWILEKEKITNCEVTGILFSDSPGPFARSFDQRSPGKGYTPENVDVVVRIYNYAKNVYDIEDVESFCRQYVTHMGKR
tara:strand:- start:2342 stop:3550 length:1209 start_codon:yes stop_codon:yes gene_type:complete